MLLAFDSARWGAQASGFDGIAVGSDPGGGAGHQVNLDWTGSGDDTHHGYDIATRPTVALATFDTTGTSSYVDGCAESKADAHLESSTATLIGARADPNFAYGRHFVGVSLYYSTFSRTVWWC